MKNPTNTTEFGAIIGDAPTKPRYKLNRFFECKIQLRKMSEFIARDELHIARFIYQNFVEGQFSDATINMAMKELREETMQIQDDIASRKFWAA